MGLIEERGEQTCNTGTTKWGYPLLLPNTQGLSNIILFDGDFRWLQSIIDVDTS